MNGNSQRIEFGVGLNLDTKNLYTQLDNFKKYLDNLTPNTKGFQDLEKIINNMERSLTKFEAKTSSTVFDSRQLSSAKKDLDKITESLLEAKISIGHLTFSDLNLSEDQKKVIQGFSEQIDAVEERFSTLKTNLTQGLFKGDNNKKLLSELGLGVNNELDQISSAVDKKVSQISRDIGKLNSEISINKPKVDQKELADKLGKINASDINSVKQAIGVDLFSNIFSELSSGAYRFKAGGRNIFVEWLTNSLDSDRTAIENDPGLKAALNRSAAAALDYIQKNKDTLLVNSSKGITNSSELEAYNKKVKQIQLLEGSLQQYTGIQTEISSVFTELTNGSTSAEEAIEKINNALQQYQTQLLDSKKNSPELNQTFTGLQASVQSTADQLANYNGELLKLQSTGQIISSLQMAISNFMGFYQILNIVRRGVKEATATIKELDTTMNAIAIVSDQSTSDLWKQVDTYSAVAQRYGASVKGAYEVSKIYYQAGYQTNDVMKLMNETLKLSKVSGLDYAQTTDYMMTALRGFKIEVADAGKVVDVYSGLAASTAVSQEELAVAMSKTASSMASVGSTFEESSAMIATMVAVTRESATNIGTALKSVASRYGELTKDPSKLLDSEGEAINYNKVDSALQSVGISLKDTEGQFRSFTDVILELSEIWDTLDSIQQRYIATQFAGNRQQSRFLALVSNKDLLQQNLETAESSEDVGTLQAIEALDSLESKIEQVRVAYQQFYLDIGVENVWKGMLDGLKNVINTLNRLPKLFNIPIGALAPIINGIALIRSLGSHLIASLGNIIGVALKKSLQETNENIKAEAQHGVKGYIAEWKAGLAQAREGFTQINKDKKIDQYAQQYKNIKNDSEEYYKLARKMQSEGAIDSGVVIDQSNARQAIEETLLKYKELSIAKKQEVQESKDAAEEKKDIDNKSKEDKQEDKKEEISSITKEAIQKTTPEPPLELDISPAQQKIQELRDSLNTQFSPKMDATDAISKLDEISAKAQSVREELTSGKEAYPVESIRQIQDIQDKAQELSQKAKQSGYTPQLANEAKQFVQDNKNIQIQPAIESLQNSLKTTFTDADIVNPQKIINALDEIGSKAYDAQAAMKGMYSEEDVSKVKSISDKAYDLSERIEQSAYSREEMKKVMDEVNTFIKDNSAIEIPPLEIKADTTNAQEAISQVTDQAANTTTKIPFEGEVNLKPEAVQQAVNEVQPGEVSVIGKAEEGSGTAAAETVIQEVENKTAEVTITAKAAHSELAGIENQFTGINIAGATVEQELFRKGNEGQISGQISDTSAALGELIQKLSSTPNEGVFSEEYLARLTKFKSDIDSIHSAMQAMFTVESGTSQTFSPDALKTFIEQIQQAQAELRNLTNEAAKTANPTPAEKTQPAVENIHQVTEESKKAYEIISQNYPKTGFLGGLSEKAEALSGMSNNIRSFGQALSLISTLFKTSTKGGQAASAAISGLGGAIQLTSAMIKGLSGGLNAIPWMAVASGIIAIVNAISTAIETPEERLKRLTEEAEELTNKAKQVKSEYSTIKKASEKYEELAAKRYESQEAADEFQEHVDSLTEKFPQLIAGFDESGNAILNAASMESVLAAARQKSADAAYEAAVKEAEVAKDRLTQAKEKLGKIAPVVSTDQVTGSLQRYEDINQLQKDLFGYEMQSISSLDNFDSVLSDITTSWIRSESHNQSLIRFLASEEGGYINSNALYIDPDKLYKALISENAPKDNKTQAFIDFYNKYYATNEPENELISDIEKYTDIFNNTQNEDERIDAYNSLMQSLDNLFSDEVNREKYWSRYGHLYEDLSSYGEALDNYFDLNDLYKVSNQQVISNWLNKQNNNTDKYNVLEETSSLTPFITRALSTDVENYSGWNEASISSEFKSRAEQLIQVASDIWTGLGEQFDENGNSLQKQFEKMTTDYKTYSGKDIAEWLVSNNIIDSGNEFYQQIIDSYEDSSNTIKENLLKQVEGISAYEEQITNATEEGTQWTSNTQTVVNKLVKQQNLLSRVGKFFGSDFTQSTAVLIPAIENDSNLLQLFLDNNINTIEGVNKILEGAKDLGYEDGSDVIEAVNTLHDNIIENVGLTIQTAKDNIVENADKQGKLISTARTGTDISQLDELFSLAETLDVEISATDFDLVGGKMVLAANKWSNLQQKWQESLMATANNAMNAYNIAVENIPENLLVTSTGRSYLQRKYRQDMVTALGGAEKYSQYFNEVGFLKEGVDYSEVYQAIEDQQVSLGNDIKEAQAIADAVVASLTRMDDFKAGDFSALDKTAQQLAQTSLSDLSGDELTAAKGIQDAWRSIFESVANGEDIIWDEIDYISEGTKNSLKNYMQSDSYDSEYFIKTFGQLYGMTTEEINNWILALHDKTQEAWNAYKTILDNSSKGEPIAENEIVALANALGEDSTEFINKYFEGSTEKGYKLTPDKQKELDDLFEEYNEQITEILLSSTDGIISITEDAFKYIHEGTNKVSDMTAFAKQFSGLTGVETSFIDLFDYSDITESFIISASKWKEIRAKAYDKLASMMTPEDATRLLDNIEKQFSDIDFKSFLDDRSDKNRNKLKQELTDYYKTKWKDESDDIINSQVNTIINNLSNGGQIAIDAIKSVKGADISSDEIEAAFKAEVSNIQDAFESLANIGINSVVSKEVKNLLEETGAGFQVSADGVITSIGNLKSAYIALYAKMKASNEATIKELNSAFATVMEYTTNSALIDAASGLSSTTFSDVGEILSNYQLSLEDFLMNNKDLYTYLGGKNLQINDLDAFVQYIETQAGVEIERGTTQWAEVLNSFNDGIINAAKVTKDAISEEVKNVAEAKIGDQVNLSYLYTQFGDNLAAAVQAFGGEFAGGILTITENTDVSGLMGHLLSLMEEIGDYTPSELGEIKDAISQLLSNIADLIKSGISGTLNNADFATLSDWAGKNGLSLTFERTAEGIKLSQQSAVELYNTISKIDSLQGQVVFESLKDTLMESNDYFKSISALEGHITELERYQLGLKIQQNKEQVELFEKQNGNVDLYHRPVIHNEDGTISTLLTTTLDSRNFESDIPWVMNITPIPPDAKSVEDIMSDEDLKDYVQSLLDKNPLTGEALLNLDKVENGGKGLIINLKEAKEVTDEMAESLGNEADELHKVSEVYEAIRAGETFDPTKINQYKQELELAKEIRAVRGTSEDSSFNFMDQALPGGMNNVLNYWSSWQKAFSAVNTAKDTGYMGYQDFVNFVTQLGELSKLTGEAIPLGENVLVNSENVASLIDQAGQALTVTADGSLKIDLASMGINFSASADAMAAGIDDGLHTFAQSQIDMLDGLIQLLETIVAMEGLSDIAGDDITLQLPEIVIEKPEEPNFADYETDLQYYEALDNYNAQLKQWQSKYGDASRAYTDDYEKWRQSIKDALALPEDDINYNEDLVKAADNIVMSVNGTDLSLRDVINKEADAFTQLDADFLNFFMYAQQADWNDDAIYESIQEIFGSADYNATIKIPNNKEITIQHGNVVLKDEKTGHYTTIDGKDLGTDLNKALVTIQEDNIKAAEEKSDGNIKLQGKKVTVTIDGQPIEFTITDEGQLEVNGQKYNNLDDYYTKTYLQEGQEDHGLTLQEFKLKRKLVVVPEITDAKGLTSDQKSALQAAGIKSFDQLQAEWDSYGDQEKYKFEAKYGFSFTPGEGSEAEFDKILADEAKTVNVELTYNEASSDADIYELLKGGDIERTIKVNVIQGDNSDQNISNILKGNGQAGENTDTNVTPNLSNLTVSLANLMIASIGTASADGVTAPIVQLLGSLSSLVIDSITGTPQLSTDAISDLNNTSIGELTDTTITAILGALGITNVGQLKKDWSSLPSNIDGFDGTITDSNVQAVLAALNITSVGQLLKAAGMTLPDDADFGSVDVPTTATLTKVLISTIMALALDDDATINNPELSGLLFDVYGQLAELILTGADNVSPSDNFEVPEGKDKFDLDQAINAIVTNLIYMFNGEIPAPTASGLGIPTSQTTSDGVTVEVPVEANYVITEQQKGINNLRSEIYGKAFHKNYLESNPYTITQDFDTTYLHDYVNQLQGMVVAGKKLSTVDFTNIEALANLNEFSIKDQTLLAQIQSVYNAAKTNESDFTSMIESIHSLVDGTIDTGSLESVASAISAIASAAQELQTISWDTIANGLKSLSMPAPTGDTTNNGINGTAPTTNNGSGGNISILTDIINATKGFSAEGYQQAAEASNNVSATQTEDLATASKNINPNNAKTAASAISGISAAGAIAARNALNNINTSIKTETAKGTLDVTVRVEKVNGKGSMAKGNVALASGTQTLMGELGPELVVSNGRYFVVGQNGAEFVDLDKDAIVFNHLQTQRLLANGGISSRGNPFTNEINAISYAKGNVSGPAKVQANNEYPNFNITLPIAHWSTGGKVERFDMAEFKVGPSASRGMYGPAMSSASSALATLKHIRSQWQAILNLSTKDLASTGGGGGGGGGGNSAFIKDLEKWYNWLQEIARLEYDINQYEAERNRISSEWNKSGHEYFQTQLKTLDALKSQLSITADLVSSQTAYFNQRRAELNSDKNPFSSLYQFDDYGQLKYKDGRLQKLSDMVGTDKYNNPNMTPEEQFKYITQTLGIDKKYLKYDASGNEIDDKDYNAMVQAFWDKIDADKEEMQTLYNSIADYTKQLEEYQQRQNEILKEMRDNQMDLEQKVYDAIVDTRERMIEELEDTKDAIKDSNDKFIEGLNNTLTKERNMYENAQSQQDLDKLIRRRDILIRSGGSAAEIADLNEQISDMQMDVYFDKQQEEIDAIQEASDKQIEKLEAQIQLETELLDYQKKYGLLWGQVTEIMSKSPEEIANYIAKNDQEYWNKSPVATADALNSLIFSSEQWVDYRDNGPLVTDLAAIKDVIVKQDTDNGDKDKKTKTDGGGKNPGGKNPGGDGKDGKNKIPDTGWILDKYEYTSNNNGTHKKIIIYKNGQKKIENNAEACTFTVTSGSQVSGWTKQCSLCGYKTITHIDPSRVQNYNVDNVEGPKDQLDQKNATNIGPSQKNGIRQKFTKLDLNENVSLSAIESELENDNSVIDTLKLLKMQFLAAKVKTAFDSSIYDSISSSVGSISSNDNSNAVSIDKIDINLNVDKLANDYDSRQAARTIKDEIVKIASKTSANNSVRR